jgi:hypothetical protein
MTSSTFARAFAVAFSSLIVGCGGGASGDTPPAAPAPIDTVGYVPTSIVADRFVTHCPSQTPAGGSVANYSLGAIGSKQAAPYESVFVSFPATTQVGAPITLTVSQYIPGGVATGTSASGGSQSATAGEVALAYDQGASKPFIDSGAFDSATATILSMPTSDAKPLTVHVTLHFKDGRVLDETFSAPLTTDVSGCAAG